MATRNSGLMLVAFVFSAIAAIFNMVSLGTEEWITGRAVWLNLPNDVNYVNYGLFQGNYKRTIAFLSNFQLTMTCNFKLNICALLCGLDDEQRQELLYNLYRNRIKSSYAMDNCPVVTKFAYDYGTVVNKPFRTNTYGYINNDKFINAGVWVCTVIFVVVAAALGLFAAVMSLYNAVSIHNNLLLNAKSLFVYNAGAFISTVLYMTLWGTMYNISIFHNLNIYDTIVGHLTSNKMAYLGYSYWIGFVSLLFYASSIGVLYYREYLNERNSTDKRYVYPVDPNPLL